MLGTLKPPTLVWCETLLIQIGHRISPVDHGLTQRALNIEPSQASTRIALIATSPAPVVEPRFRKQQSTAIPDISGDDDPLRGYHTQGVVIRILRNTLSPLDARGPECAPIGECHHPIANIGDCNGCSQWGLAFPYLNIKDSEARKDQHRCTSRQSAGKNSRDEPTPVSHASKTIANGQETHGCSSAPAGAGLSLHLLSRGCARQASLHPWLQPCAPPGRSGDVMWQLVGAAQS